MSNASLEKYIASLYGLNVRASAGIDERDAQNLVNDILISLLLAELSQERHEAVMARCGDIVRALTAREKMLSAFHGPMNQHASDITKLSHALKQES